MAKDEVRVILVDDHHIVRRGLAALLQLDSRYRVVAEAANGEEALRVADETAADIMILDLAMPRLNGLETIRRIASQHPDLHILVLSMYDDTEFVTQALQDGAHGYLLKESMDDELFSALNAITYGDIYISKSIQSALPENPSESSAARLTPREREMLQLIAEGYTTAEIARFMIISVHTAGRHRANIMKKLDVHNQVELVRLAVQQGWVILDQPSEFLPKQSD
ncbi:MAG: response regulator transcription factor [Caldilineaceae bacterium]|nr:response regulator transcription factor [Caldilineaceae bacterium]